MVTRGQVGLEVLERERGEGREGDETEKTGSGVWKEDGAEPHGLEKPQVARDRGAGKWNRVVVKLPNLGVQLTERAVCSLHRRIRVEGCNAVQQLRRLALTVKATT